MKANKFFAWALAAVTMFGFASCNPEPEGGPNNGPDGNGGEATLALDQTSIQLEVGQTATLTATVEATWSTNNEEAISVEGNGLTAEITALAEGTAIVTATTEGGQTKTCVVNVKAAGTVGGEETVALKGTQVWPIILDGETYAANESKIVASFQPNDVDQFLYVWDGTYDGGAASGLNFHGNGEGYTSLVVTGAGWSGAGYCLTESGAGWEAAKALNDAIVADPDSYFLHLAIKSTDNYAHCFYFMGSEETKFVLGTKSVYDGPVMKDFTRDGSWQEFDIPMSTYAAALASADVKAGVNVFVMLTEGVQGAALNLDAVYFYKK